MAPGTADVWQVDESGQLPALAGVGLDDGQVLVVVHGALGAEGGRVDGERNVSDCDVVVDPRMDQH